MSEPIKPALTAEEWKAALDNEFVRQQMLVESCDPVKGNDHKRAALSLYGKPEGFTREMVDALKVAASALHDSYEGTALHDKEIELAWAAIENLESLLPPEKE